MGWFSTQLPKSLHYCFNIFFFFFGFFLSSCYINASRLIVLLPLISTCIYKRKIHFVEKLVKTQINKSIKLINKHTKQVINPQAFEPQTFIHSFIYSFVSFICVILSCPKF